MTSIPSFSEILQPTFVIDHPLSESPLAKEHRDKPFVAERFELVVSGCELVNAYTEQNDPEVQRQLFEMQSRHSDSGLPDDWYVQVLEYGLPPTGGWGMGLDRLVMLLTGQTSIKEVLLFPTIRPKLNTPNPSERP